MDTETMEQIFRDARLRYEELRKREADEIGQDGQLFIQLFYLARELGARVSTQAAWLREMREKEIARGNQ